MALKPAKCRTRRKGSLAGRVGKLIRSARKGRAPYGGLYVGRKVLGIIKKPAKVMPRKSPLPKTGESTELISKQKLLDQIKGFEGEIKKLKSRKKYGLVWEEKREDVIERCKTELPVLKEVKGKAISKSSDNPVNVLIEGDNYHALSVLNYTHKGKIDVIYIDPPYNTGNKSWKYNNHYVEKDDAFRHSKFLSFVSKRVKLAKKLLSDEGIIVCAIDDYEHQNVRHLFDEVFGENNRLATIAVVHNPGGRQDDKYFATAHEYMLVYAKNRDLAKVGHLEISEKKLAEYKFEDKFGKYKLREYRRSGANSRPQDRPNLWYPIYVHPKTLDLQIEKRTGYKELLPVDPRGIKRVWRWNADTFIEKKEKYIEVKRTGKDFTLAVKERLDDNKGQKPKTIWNESYYSSTVGTAELKNILGNHFKGEKIFDFPKSKFLVRDIIELTSNSSSIVLDFFAGSGTTGQAVLELNEKMGGSRQFILCTNNENEICEKVCYPRVGNIIKGYTTPTGVKIEGLGGNLKYYRTDFLPSIPSDRNKKNLVNKSTEMLCLKEGCFDLVKSGRAFRIFKDYGDRYLGIIYDDEGIERLKSEAKKLNKNFVVYIFSLDESAREEDFEDMKNLIELKPIPDAILNVYKRIFR